ncbi:hypothetical protein [Paenibacillus typhae]|uniref:hypothetical protein n=1 Tax=Paenibacillus typhae TaxID=1174501 RepID=UPI001C8D88E1|nr:hypothetical protein [Paenibacillus typhae]MBY0011630.1 hypothetical protein [Paenibacillus typhae]
MGLKMYYKDTGGWFIIPDWSYFFIDLGKELACRNTENKRWTAALTLPAKEYIAPFIGVGILSSIFMGSSFNDLMEEHFRNLSLLEKNTPVWYRKNKRVLKAVFLGTTDFEGEQRLLIQTQSTKAGGLTEYISKKDALEIQLNPNENQRLPKNQKGRSMTAESPLTDAVFGLRSQALLKQSKTRICFVGGREQFEDEITRKMFAVYEDNQMIKGSLNDLLRVRQFQYSVDPYQSQFVSSLARKNEIDLNMDPASIVVYSGSNGYLNWKEDFLYTNSVVILDRSEPQFESAVEEVNNRYIQSNKKPYSRLNLGVIPGGIELLYWEET